MPRNTGTQREWSIRMIVVTDTNDEMDRLGELIRCAKKAIKNAAGKINIFVMASI